MLSVDKMSSKFYTHYSQIPRSIWIWSNFTPKEIASPDDGSILLDIPALTKLQNLRDTLNKPLIINSAYRSTQHNKDIGGKPHSNHLLGIAFDISLKNHDKDVLYKTAKACGFTGFGIYKTWLHIDTGIPREWKE